MCKGPDPSKPSDTLRKLVLVNIGMQALQKSQQNTATSLQNKKHTMGKQYRSKQTAATK